MNILVTGPSGSGKSVTARKLAKEQNLPLVKLDDYPEWKSFEKNRKNYELIAKALVRKALKEPGKKVIEGQQIMSLDKIPKGVKIVLVDPGKDTTVAQRLRRSIKKAKEKGEPITKEFVAKKKKTAENLYDLSNKDLVRLGLKKEAQWSKPTKDFWNDVVLQNMDYLRYLVGHKYNIGAAGVKTGLTPGKILAHDWTKFEPKKFDVYEDYFFGPEGIKGTKSPKLHKIFRKEVDDHYRSESHHNDKIGLPESLQTQIESVVDWYSVGKTNAGMKGTDFPTFKRWWNAKKDGFLGTGKISKEVYTHINDTLKKDYNILSYSVDKIKEVFK